MKGKEKCRALKEIRKQIAVENDIPYVVSQCTHQGDCKGTCPKCESELKYLERELAIRQGLGKAVAVVGISAGVCSSLTACTPIQNVTEWIENIGYDELSGDTQIMDPDDIAGMEVLPEIYPEDTNIDPDDITGMEVLPETCPEDMDVDPDDVAGYLMEAD